MSRRILPLILLSVALGGCAAGGALWDLTTEPEPVVLPAGADTLSPYAYYQHATSILEKRPGEAIMAFRWASRLDPTWGAPLYGLRLALLMHDPYFFPAYWFRERRVRDDPRTARLDTLYLRALTLNPFLERQFDAQALRFLIKESYRREEVRQGAPPLDDASLDFYLEQYLRRAEPGFRAWLAHGDGRYAEAARNYRLALERMDFDESAGTRAELARVLFRMGSFDAAYAAMDSAVLALREQDDEDLVRIYDSKAVYEHTAAMILEALQDSEGARGRYALALQEDLSYHPAHLRLAALAIADRDTAAAVGELELALQIAPQNANVLLSAGRGFMQLGMREQAATHLRTLIELEPHFAEPLLDLARVLDAEGEEEQAAALYRRFLERSSRTNPGRGEAQARLQAIDVAAGGADR